MRLTRCVLSQKGGAVERSDAPTAKIRPKASAPAQRRARAQKRWRRVRAAVAVTSVLKDYCVNSSFHGLRFVADSQRHWTERQNNAISFAAETNYIDWNTEFPTVAVCETDNDDRIDWLRSQFENSDERNYDIDEVYKEITYFRGEGNFIKSTCFSPDGVFDENSGCPVNNFVEIAKTYRTPCSLMFGECSWNGEPFKCCDHFRPLPTEIGTCFAFNSVQTDSGPVKPLNTQSNKKTGAGKLMTQIAVPTTVYVLARQEVPTLNSIERVKFSTKEGTLIKRWFSVKDVENEALVHEATLRQRGCRFRDGDGDARAHALQVYRKYSYSACITQCRKDEQLRLCNCTSHQTPRARPEEICDMKGLLCLSAHYMRLSVLRHKDSKQNRLYCPCTLSCEDQELKDTYGTLSESSLENVSTVYVMLDSLPTVRFKRHVVRGKLDLVVYMGGTTGLLVGASLLSFVEVLYYFTLRVCGGSDDKSASASGGTKTESAPASRTIEVFSTSNSVSGPRVEMVPANKDSFMYQKTSTLY
ncbi:Sodium channel protein Nach [Gryllus bimaculatus]|nr:Sodium channel protein Nach [Gryllus bimaculatus]